MNWIMQYHDKAHRAAEGKLHKLAAFVMPLKIFGAAIFSGFIILYMVSSVLYARVTGEAFSYAIPFVFVLQGLLLAALISLFWGLLFSGVLIKKWRYFPRIVIFSLSVMALLAACFLTFMAIPTDWAGFWLTTNGVVGLGLIVFSVIGEMHFQATGKRYTEILKNFQASI
jgi:hypothetical protein